MKVGWGLWKGEGDEVVHDGGLILQTLLRYCCKYGCFGHVSGVGLLWMWEGEVVGDFWIDLKKLPVWALLRNCYLNYTFLPKHLILL